ncbi:MAG: ThuA domain-containing protein [Verrucomicrobiaceae bacterium]|nr:ThuA domain-containing protein [Verrucomicrobiaceae bacterium]
MKHILFALALLCSLITASQASNIVIMVVEDPNNYEAPRTMRDFAEKQLRPLGHHVTIIDGDQPQPHHFAGLVEALQDADPVRTANHAFIPKPKEVIDPSLVSWPEFTDEVLGAPNTGYETQGLPYTVRIAPGAENSPLLAGVKPANILGAQSLYKVLPLAADVTPLLIGTAKTDTSPPMPIAWTRTYGSKKARVFYTSLGAPEDMEIADVRTLLVNAVNWTLKP